jgi:DNA-binding response OmpR family regulator
MESILIVDDDINLCTVLKEELGEVGYDTRYLNGGERVSNYLKDNHIDLILLDLKMPGKDGFDVLQDMKHLSNSHPKIIVLTAYADVKSAIESANWGLPTLSVNLMILMNC